MMLCYLPLLLCLLQPLGARAGGGKYSREVNENRADEEAAEFRIQRLNQVWEKAQRLRQKNDDKWRKEAKLRRSLTYGLDGKKKPRQDNTYIKDGTDEMRQNTSVKFSEEDMATCGGFLHHRKRLRKIHQNVISPDENEIKVEDLHGKHADLKDKLRSINHGFDRLRKISHEGFSGERDFNEPRVNDLWDMARSANFSPSELDSFKEELKHFETKIEKHQHYQKQLEISHEKLRHIAETGDKEHIKKSKEKYNALTDKIKELGYKVKKHLQDLTSRVSKDGLPHNEL
ncbi:hypothetical protein GDO81_000122 [Engystomops pustulosus]|uniref:Alpha-2-macroglobulin RAP C-terminal domain-containing protein n=1 Tax=Engystomops pustulosus TaxID=76066 RepID=A0AAV7D3S8_ENGPU|nr:hypothetical protein GDO81_000122 [Engystomops pustulosus]